MRLRTPPSGPETIGTAATNQVLVWNNTTKEWDVAASSTVTRLPAGSLVAGVAVPALAAAGDTANVSVPVAAAVPGDVALVTSTTAAGSGVVVSGAGLCLIAGSMGVVVIATKAYAGANEDFFVTLVKTA